MPHLYIVRGLPGSGKSTFAESLGKPFFEADQFRMVDGKYVYNPDENYNVHKKCYDAVVASLEEGNDTVVSNTFTRIWEMQHFLDLGYPFTVITVEGNHGNVHNVPPEIVEQMRARWEPYNI